MSLNSESRGAIQPFRSFGFGPYFLKMLAAFFSAGRLTIVAPGGEIVDHRGARPGPEAVLALRRWRAIRRLILRGEIGFAESYVDGDWTSSDLVALLELAAKNAGGAPRLLKAASPARLIGRFHHLRRANTKSGSRRNIAAHYDIGNDFYRLWLDSSMTYSSALFDGSAQTLEAGQDNKFRKIEELLNLTGRESVLEIGFGWGSLARRLAALAPKVTGVTLSSEQLAYAEALAIREGLAHKLDLRFQDYRDVGGRFDRIVSIEMLEAVGEEYWPAYFAKLCELLAPGGKAVLQVITIAEERFDSYRKGADFIQLCIFPGGMLPSRTVLAAQIARAGLTLTHVHTFGDSYALTIKEWRRRFMEAEPALEMLGFPARLRRLWEFYLAYCEAGFRIGTIDVGLYAISG